MRFSLLIVGLLSLQGLAAVPPTWNRGESIPLVRKSRNHFTRDDWEHWAKREAAFLQSRYGGSSEMSKRAEGTNLLGNSASDSIYWGSVAIGSPAVAFDVILDTGSSDLWVSGSACGSSCSHGAQFNPSASSTFQNLSQPFAVQYGSGNVGGSLVSDTVQMAGFSVQNQPFGVVEEVQGDLLTSPISGLLGLAWQTIAATGKMPFWQTLVSSGAWTQPVMAFQLTRYINDTRAPTSAPGGSFTMGFVNTSLYTGDIDYQSIGSIPSFWFLSLTGLTVQGQNISLTVGAPNAAIDTGTTLVGGPPNVIQSMFAQIPGSQPGTGSWTNYYTYPCSTKVNVTMTFGGRTWPISPADFQLTQLSSSQCVGAFFSLNGTTGFGDSGNPTWVVGDTFLKNVFSVFRYNPPAVGFAQLSATALAMNGASGNAPSATIGTVSASATAGASSPRLHVDSSMMIVASILALFFAML